MTTEKPIKKSSILDDFQQNIRFDRWVEFISAIVLSLATVGIAWCGYQAAQWNGQKAFYATQANTSQIQAAQLANRAVLADSRNVSLFIDWSAALFGGNQEFANFLMQRFPTELAVATETWLAFDPENNPDAPLSPFELPAYQLKDLAESERHLTEAQEFQSAAGESDKFADRYILLTVLFASVLFFGGVSGKFKSKVIDLGMLAIAFVLFTSIVLILVSNPIILEF